MGNQCASCSGAPEEGEILMKVTLKHSLLTVLTLLEYRAINHQRLILLLIHLSKLTAKIMKSKPSRFSLTSEARRSENKPSKAPSTRVSSP